MLKKAYKRFYKKYFYNALKRLEESIRAVFFSLCDCIFPSFNAFKIFGIPRGVATHAGTPICEPIYEKRMPPKSIESFLPSTFPPSLTALTSGGRVAIFENGFATRTAANLTSTGHILSEFTEQFTLSHIRRHKLFTVRAKRFFAEIPHFDTSVASLSVDGQWNYYHWLFDVLPKIHLIEKKGIAPEYFYCDYSRQFQKETLDYLNIPSQKILPTEKYPVISASSLIVTSFPCLGATPRWATEYLRNLFKDLMKPESGYPKRIFISRREASYRRILNEESLYPFLQEEGFTSIQLEKLSFAQQVKYFSSAEIILAPHGAGLANLIFASPGTKIIEIFAPRFPCICYWTLSNLLGLDYYFLNGEDNPLTYSSETEGYDHIWINPEKVKKTFSFVENLPRDPSLEVLR